MIKKFMMFISLFAAMTLSAQDEVKTVPSVDLNKYMGKWYIISQLVFPWEVTCARNANVTYTMTGTDTFDVVNHCEKFNKSKIEAKGTGKIVDTKTNTKMNISYNWFNSYSGIFSGDYWIIQLADDYSYAVVGDPKGSQVMILSRTPTLPDSQYQPILDKVTLQFPNLNVLNMLKIEQSEK